MVSIPAANEPVAGNAFLSRLTLLKLTLPGARECEPHHISTFAPWLLRLQLSSTISWSFGNSRLTWLSIAYTGAPC
jgi:hypothetical protein